MVDATLVTLAREVRGSTLMMLDGLSDHQARFAALSNSILWHAGHALVVVEHLSVMPLTGGSAGYPPAYFAAFSWKSNPRGVTDWPAVAEVRGELQSQFDRLLAAMERATPEQLDAKDARSGRTVRWSVVHGLHDEARHQGEMWLLRKMLLRGA